MSVPTFNGQPIFGRSPIIHQVDIPREGQVNAFFGLDGLERLDGGDRGLESHASGILWGPGELGLGAALALFRSQKDGLCHTLVDTLGQTWGNVLLHTFQAEPEIKATPAGYRWVRYQAVFHHLSSS